MKIFQPTVLYITQKGPDYLILSYPEPGNVFSDLKKFFSNFPAREPEYEYTWRKSYAGTS